MLRWVQWQEKAKSSLEASQILIEKNKPAEAISRAYYAAYQMVTGVLIKLKLNPRSDFGNWSHHETLEMYRIHICQKVDLGYKEKEALKNLYPKFRMLLETRYKADYSQLSTWDASRAQTFWRDANQVVSLLNSLFRRGKL